MLFATNRKSHVDFPLADLNLTVAYSKGQLDSWNGVAPSILALFWVVLMYSKSKTFRNQINTICCISSQINKHLIIAMKYGFERDILVILRTRHKRPVCNMERKSVATGFQLVSIISITMT